MGTVISMIDRMPSPVTDVPEFREWALAWIEAMVAGEYGPLRSMVIVMENMDGQTAMISQSLGSLDRARLIGLLEIAKHRRVDGHTIDELQR